MALGKRRKVEEESEIDLTPMLDVVFIMLIFFIVTASFVKESGIEVNRPPAAPPSDEQPKLKNLTLRVTANDEIFVGSRRIDARAVRANVERMKAENPEGKVIIQASPHASTEIYIQIADQAREAGVYDIALNTTKEK
ncbi:biopolymer transporter ExbD [Porticoccaceae bacterium LTM1]|nr:biopolymer transporter ExbD [Porticoccaceae bacterium LTM1]